MFETLRETQNLNPGNPSFRPTETQETQRPNQRRKALGFWRSWWIPTSNTLTWRGSFVWAPKEHVASVFDRRSRRFRGWLGQHRQCPSSSSRIDWFWGCNLLGCETCEPTTHHSEFQLALPAPFSSCIRGGASDGPGVSLRKVGPGFCHYKAPCTAFP